MTRDFFIIIFLTSASFLSAQDNPFTFGEIPTADLAMEIYEADSSASAVVLFDRGEIQFGQYGDYQFANHKRVKIFQRSAFDEGDISITYLKGGGYNLYELKASVIAPDGSKTELNEEDMFDEKVTKYLYRKKFSIPNLQEGSIIEYSYQLKASNLVSLRNWYFQTDIPTRYSELKIKVPRWLEYIFVLQGDLQPTRQEVTTSRGTYFGSGYSEDNTRYIFENVPALKPEAYITTMDDYRSGVQFQLKGFAIPGTFVEEFMTSWDQLANFLLEDSRKFAEVYKRKGTYRIISEAVEPLVNNNMSEREKAQVIYDFVNSSMEWDESYSIFCSEMSLSKPFKKRKGNSADLNLIVAAMLRQQKIDFTPILISTRAHGKMYPYYPIVKQFNHVILKANLDGEEVYIDATGSSHQPLGLLREAALNKIGWQVERGEFSWIEIKPQTAVNVMIANLDLDKDGALAGHIQCVQKEYTAIRERELISKQSDEEYLQKRLANSYTDVEIENLAYKNLTEPAKELQTEFDCELGEVAQVAGDLIYFAPIIHSDFLENPFQLKIREYPVDITYPIQEQSIISIKIPDGYVVEELPKNVNLILPNQGGKFQYLLSTKGNTIKLINKVIINQLFFAREEYSTIKEFCSLIATKLEEQIVLKKKV